MFHLTDFLIYCFITAYTPGANNLLSMSNAIRLGFRRSIRFNFGIFAGFAIVMSVCTIFSTTLFTLLPKVKLIMQILGAAYMLYLAWKVWKSSVDPSVDSGKAASFLSGMVLQFANPKIYIYAITAMTLYILPVYHSIGAIIGFTILLAVIGASGHFLARLFVSIFPDIQKVLILSWRFYSFIALLLYFYNKEQQKYLAVILIASGQLGSKFTKLPPLQRRKKKNVVAGVFRIVFLKERRF